MEIDRINPEDTFVLVGIFPVMAKTMDALRKKGVRKIEVRRRIDDLSSGKEVFVPVGELELNDTPN